MEILTAGSSQSSAAEIYQRLEEHQSTSVVHIRANANSRLGGFTKADSLEFFLGKILSISYIQEPLLTPKSLVFRLHRQNLLSWADYRERYITFLILRNLASYLSIEGWGERLVFLWNEQDHKFCYRTLAAQYLAHTRQDISLVRHI